jgi:hypothetical protein
MCDSNGEYNIVIKEAIPPLNLNDRVITYKENNIHNDDRYIDATSFFYCICSIF